MNPGVRLSDFKYLLVILLLLFTALSLFMRYALSDLQQYAPALKTIAAEKFDLDVEIGELNGRWIVYAPVLEIKDLSVKSLVENNVDSSAGIKINRVVVQLDVLESLLQLAPRFKKVLIQGVSTKLSQDKNGFKLEGVDLQAFKTNPAPKTTIDELVDENLLSIKQVFLRDINLDIEAEDFVNGSVFVSNLALEQAWLGHHLSVDLSIDDGFGEIRELNLKSHFQGNPLRRDTLSANAYLSLPKTSVSEWLPNKYFGGLGLYKLDMGGEFWLSVAEGSLSKVKGRIDLEDIGLIAKQAALIDSINFINLDFEWAGDFDREWSLKVKDLNMDWRQQQVRHIAFIFDKSFTYATDYPLTKPWDSFEKQTEEEIGRFVLRDKNEVLAFPAENSRSRGSDRKEVMLTTKVLVNTLPLSLVEPALSLLEQVNEQQLGLVKKAAISGELQGVQFFQQENIKGEKIYHGSLELKSIGFNENEKIPGVESFDTYLEFAPKVVGLEFDSDGFLLKQHPMLFRKNVDVTSLSGNLLVEMLPSEIVAHSDLVKVATMNQSAQGVFAMNVPNRFYADGEKELPSWSIQAWISEDDGVELVKFIPGRLPPGFLNWADNTVKDGVASGNLMLFAFSKKRLPDTFLMFGADVVLENGVFDYMPGKWPAVAGVGGRVRMHNERVYADVATARMFGTYLEKGTITIPSYLKQDAPRILLEGKTSGPLTDAKSLFQNSLLKDSLGEMVEDWEIAGASETIFDMQFPLPTKKSEDDLTEYAVAKSKLLLDLKLEDGGISLPKVDLAVSDLQGDVRYSLDEGMFGDNVTGTFFDKPVEGRLDTLNIDGEKVYRVKAKGELSADDLQDWTDFWFFETLEGNTKYDASLLVGSERGIDQVNVGLGGTSLINTGDTLTRVRIESDLDGMSVVLPGEYAKAKAETAPLITEIDVFEQNLVYRVAYNSTSEKPLGLIARTKAGELDSATINFGSGLLPLNNVSGITVSGEIGLFDYDNWMAYFEEYLVEGVGGDAEVDAEARLDENLNNTKNLESSSGKQPDTADILNRIEVTLNEFVGFSQYFENTDTVVTRQQGKWRIQVKNNVLSGYFLVPDEDLINRQQPIFAELDYLVVTEEQFSREEARAREQQNNTLASSADREKAENEGHLGITPSDFTHIQLRVKSISLNGQKHGRWEVDLYPDEFGLDFEVHQLHYGLLSINGLGRWNYLDDVSTTKFKGHLRTGAVSNLFTALKLKPSSKSNGLMALNIYWPGDPFSFDPDLMEGKVGLEIFDGSIIEIDVKSKKLKALGIFNLGFISDVVTLKVFKKIGKGLKIDKLLGIEEKEED